jgi:two-component system, NtrC family, response regulator AtoC
MTRLTVSHLESRYEGDVSKLSTLEKDPSMQSTESSGASVDTVILDPKMRGIVDMLDKIALTQIPILLLGETGVGKEVIAESIHGKSGRPGAPLVKLNCAGLTESVVESELFGHERGAFTGAIQAHEGLFERADDGTLLLDEIGELPARTQAKLLRVLESGELLRVGGSRARKVTVRIIAATHRNLARMVERGEFRQDLYFRLNAVTIEVPPLRERLVEVLPLAELFLERCARTIDRAGLELDPLAVSALLAHSWPGNVRELRNVIERAAAMSSDTVIRAESLGLSGATRSVSDERPYSVRPAPAASPWPLAAQEPGNIRNEVRAFERARIVAALRSTMGNQTQAAKLLGVSRRTLTNKLVVHGLERRRRALFDSIE